MYHDHPDEKEDELCGHVLAEIDGPVDHDDEELDQQQYQERSRDVVAVDQLGDVTSSLLFLSE